MPHHKRTAAELAALKARIVRTWNELDPDLRPAHLAQRYGCSPNLVAIAIREALADGRTTRPLRPPPTPGMRRGRPTGGAGRMTDGGWVR